MTGCVASAAPFVAALEGAVVILSRVPLAATAVAVKTTGLPLFTAAVADTLYDCAVLPSTHCVSAAMPEALVWTIVDEPSAPPPDTCDAGVPTLNVTPTPGRGLLNASTTFTDGGTATAVPTVACCPLPPLRPRFDVGPTLIVMLFELADTMEPSVNFSV